MEILPNDAPLDIIPWPVVDSYTENGLTIKVIKPAYAADVDLIYTARVKRRSESSE